MKTTTIRNRYLVIRSLATVHGLAFLLAAFEAWPATCVSPPTGIVAWWPGEGSADDIAGTNTGTLLNGVTFASGRVGQAFSFNGTSSYIRVADNPSLHFTNALTIEAWVYPTSHGAFHEIVSKWDFNNPIRQRSYTATVSPAGQAAITVSPDADAEGIVSVGSTSVLPLNQWTHIAGTYDGSALRVYINGVCETQAAYDQGIFPGTNDLAIGGVAGASEEEVLSPFAGLIDEPGLYDRALSGVEIEAIYNAGAAGKCGWPTVIRQPRNAVGYWGKSIIFTVGAVGVAPLSYQWQTDSGPIAGATESSLVLTNLQLTNAGNYYVVITNSLGSTTSSNACLTMNPAGVSLALYAGVTIDGVVGLTYGIQYSTNLNETNSWRGIANVTLSIPTQLWFDTQPASQPQRYYRVVQGPISIP